MSDSERNSGLTAAGVYGAGRGFLLVLALVLILITPPDAHGQSRDLTGAVVDSLTNEVLPNVVVSLGEPSLDALTDAFGRFSLVGLGDGPIELTIERLSYQTLVMELAEVPTEPLRVMLSPDGSRSLEYAFAPGHRSWTPVVG